MASAERKPWDQLEDESDTAYLHFCFYRDLGPGRTLNEAYWAYLDWCEANDRPEKAKEGQIRPKLPGNWNANRKRFQWADRCAAWDLSHIAETGREAAVAFVAAVRGIALRLLQGLPKAVGPIAWDDYLESLKVLSAVIPPETVAAISNPAAHAGDNAVSSNGGVVSDKAGGVRGTAAEGEAVGEATGDLPGTSETAV